MDAPSTTGLHRRGAHGVVRREKKKSICLFYFLSVCSDNVSLCCHVRKDEEKAARRHGGERRYGMRVVFCLSALEPTSQGVRAEKDQEKKKERETKKKFLQVSVYVYVCMCDLECVRKEAAVGKKKAKAYLGRTRKIGTRSSAHPTPVEYKKKERFGGVEYPTPLHLVR